MTDSLFPDLEPVAAEVGEKPLSADRRRTLRQHADVERGLHPLLLIPLKDNGQRCGTCQHRIRNHHGYPKCDQYMTFSAATDCRAWWPACVRWTPIESPATTTPTEGNTP